MKKYFIYLLVIGTFIGCNNEEEVPVVPAVLSVDNEPILPPPIDFELDKIIERGVLKVAVENNSIGYFTYKGRTMGYQYELINELAKFLKVELEIVVTRNIQETFRLLNAGDVDVIAFTLTVTSERKKMVLFADYQYTISQMLVQKKPDNWEKLKQQELILGIWY